MENNGTVRNMCLSMSVCYCWTHDRANLRKVVKEVYQLQRFFSGIGGTLCLTTLSIIFSSKFLITEPREMLSRCERQRTESHLRTRREAWHLAVTCSQRMNQKCKFNLVKDIIISVLGNLWIKKRTSERTCTIYSFVCPTLGFTF